MEKAVKLIDKSGFIICPICKGKTRQKATKETAYRQIKDRKA